jgi:hypothetical protein
MSFSLARGNDRFQIDFFLVSHGGLTFHVGMDLPNVTDAKEATFLEMFVKLEVPTIRLKGRGLRGVFAHGMKYIETMGAEKMLSKLNVRQQAIDFAEYALQKIFGFHPDLVSLLVIHMGERSSTYNCTINEWIREFNNLVLNVPVLWQNVISRLARVQTECRLKELVCHDPCERGVIIDPKVFMSAPAGERINPVDSVNCKHGQYSATWHPRKNSA